MVDDIENNIVNDVNETHYNNQDNNFDNNNVFMVDEDLFGDISIDGNIDVIAPSFVSVSDIEIEVFRFKIKLKEKEVFIHIHGKKQLLFDYCNEINYKIPIEWNNLDEEIAWVIESNKPVINIPLYNKILKDFGDTMEYISTTINKILLDKHNSNYKYEAEYIAEHLCV